VLLLEALTLLSSEPIPGESLTFDDSLVIFPLKDSLILPQLFKLPENKFGLTITSLLSTNRGLTVGILTSCTSALELVVLLTLFIIEEVAFFSSLPFSS